MKIFKTLSVASTLAYLLAGTSMSWAQDASAGPSVDVGLNVATTYIWRGEDIYLNKFHAEGAQQGIFNFGPSLMPSITVHSPVEGLSFNIWAALALTGRDNAGGDLHAADEIDYTVAYEFSNAAGDWSAAIILYTYPTAIGGVPIDSYSELAFSYTAPVLLSPTIGTAVSMGVAGGNTSYHTFGVGHDFEMGSFSISPGLNYGYWAYYADNSQNWSHLDISVAFAYAISENFSISLTPVGVLRFFPAGSETAVLGASTYNRPAFISAVDFGVSYSF